MIKNIILKEVASYDNAGTTLSNLTQINFIYGANGSGKTTLSNFLANPLDKKFHNCYIEWKQETPIKILVYNKKFRDENFGKDSINGIFTLGKATKKEKELIIEKQKELSLIAEEGKKKKETLDKQIKTLETNKEDFKEWCWKNIYKKYEEDFKEAFKGFQQKNSFRDRVLNEFQNISSKLASKEELYEKAKTIFGDIPKSLDLIYNINFEIITKIELHPIWSKKIIGKNDVDIAKLIQKLNINDWVNQGREYLQNDGICPFCQQKTITEDFKKQLEDYFDENFTEDIKLVQSLRIDYIQRTRNIENQLKDIYNTQKSLQNSKLNLELFSAYLETVKNQFATNIKTLDEKLKEPSRSLELLSTAEQLNNISILIIKTNDKIKEHNQIVINYKDEKNKLITSIWKYLVYEQQDTITKYIKKTSGLKNGINALEKAHKNKQKEWIILNNEIKELNKNVTSIQPTIDEINRLLKYYGFTNFEIVPSIDDKNKYQIKRADGSLAEPTLSEGEITFITFLYYFQLTKGALDKENISEDRVLVIDDPISSLDSDILFVVSSLVKTIIKDIKNNIGNIKQIIILTHNVYFHKEVSFVDMRDNGGKHTHYWIVRKNNNISKFYPYETNNPIKTSYQLLWQELKEKNNSNVTLQNTMRRIIENYFKILGDYKDDTLIDKFDTYEEKIICTSLLSWMNDGSHSINDDLFIEIQDNSIDKYLDVFKRIFIHTNHEGHYNMMMAIKNKEDHDN